MAILEKINNLGNPGNSYGICSVNTNGCSGIASEYTDNIIRTNKFIDKCIGKNGKRRYLIYDDFGNYKIPKFNDVQVSTMTIICYTNLVINTDKLFQYIPITDFIIVKKKRGRKKKIQMDEDPNKHIPPGSIISISNKKDIRGVLIKSKKKSGKYFRHSVCSQMMLSNKKMLNVKISKQGKFQMTGCKSIKNAIEYIKYLYELMIETEEWTGEILFTYKNESKLTDIDLEESNDIELDLNRTQTNGLSAIFKISMKNIDFSTNYKIRRDLLNNFINQHTEFRSIFESSIATSVNIKIKSENKFDTNMSRLRITTSGECIEDNITFEEFFNGLTPKEQKNEYKKESFHTFLVFASGSIIMSSAGKHMQEIFYKIIKLLIDNRDKFEEKENENLNINTDWLDI